MDTFLYSTSAARVRAGDDYFILREKSPAVITDCTDVVFSFREGYLDSSYCRKLPELSKNMRIIELYGGILLFPILKRDRNEKRKKLIERRMPFRGDELSFAVHSDGGFVLSVVGSYNRCDQELPFEPRAMEIYPHKTLPIFLIVLKGVKIAAVAVDVSAFNVIFSTVCDEISVGDTVTVTTKRADILKHVTIDEWKIAVPFECIGRKVERTKKEVVSEIIPYAFLEEVALGGDYSHFLSAELKERAALIPEFLRRFDAIIPPCAEGYGETIALISDCKARYLKIKCDDCIRDVAMEDYPF